MSLRVRPLTLPLLRRHTTGDHPAFPRTQREKEEEPWRREGEAELQSRGVKIMKNSLLFLLSQQHSDLQNTSVSCASVCYLHIHKNDHVLGRRRPLDVPATQTPPPPASQPSERARVKTRRREEHSTRASAERRTGRSYRAPSKEWLEEEGGQALAGSGTAVGDPEPPPPVTL